MAETFSDSPLASTSGIGRDVLLPSSQHKRNNRHRKQRQTLAAQSDGVVSEPGTNAAPSPRAKKTDRTRQNLAPGGLSGQPTQSAGNAPATRSRPIPVNGAGVESPFKEQAYAGPTFQSSPAASALPMPKFFSKSAPNAAGKASLQGVLAAEKASDQTGSSPEADVIQPVPPSREAQQSPLDVFFNADRAEREALKIARQGGERTPHARQMAQTNTVRDTPYNTPARSGRNAFLSELDGERYPQQTNNTRDPVFNKSPAGDWNPFAPNASAAPDNSDDERRAYTQSLKNLLFDSTARQASTSPPHSTSQSPRTPESVYVTPPAQHPSSVPTTPQNGPNAQNQHSLHYGNRNLSPLFKAARSETPSRPSSLRQEMSYDGASATDSAIDVNSPRPPPTQYPLQYSPQYARYQQGPEPHSRSVMPSYLAQQPYSSSPINTAYASPATNSNGWKPSEPPNSPRANESHDIRTMEDDLRRMLKLNVLS